MSITAAELRALEARVSLCCRTLSHVEASPTVAPQCRAAALTNHQQAVAALNDALAQLAPGEAPRLRATAR